MASSGSPSAAASDNATPRLRRKTSQMTTVFLLAFCGALMLLSENAVRIPNSIIQMVGLKKKRGDIRSTRDNTQTKSIAVNNYSASTNSNTTAENENDTLKPKLEFLHITKTGGSAIEKAAASQAGIAWGACHYNHGLFKQSGCPWPPNLENKIRLKQNHPFSTPQLSKWHVPLQYLQPYPFQSDTKIFTVVRNPYDRAVSLYYCPWAGYKGPDADDVNHFNAWIQGRIKKQEGILLTPQSMYVFDEEHQRMVDHIIQYERLSEEFNQLMQEYNIPVTLPHQKHNAGTTTGTKRFTKNNLTSETIALINEVYRDDFDNFGYKSSLKF